MDNISTTDATDSQFGNLYQYLIILETVLRSSDCDPDETIYIETDGDMAYGNSSTEFKHHKDDSTLGKNHIDFWKTLYNRCNEEKKYNKYINLIFHTTARLPKDSPFENRDQQTKEKRFEIITKILEGAAPKNVEKYFSYIKKIEKNKLELILARIILSLENPNIHQKKEELLKKESIFKSVKNKENKESLLSCLLGVILNDYITEKEIRTKGYRERVSPILMRYQKHEFLIPAIGNSNSFNKESYKKKKFIQELETIGIDIEQHITAIKNYTYVEGVYIENSKHQGLMNELLNVFCPELIEELILKKSQHLRIIKDQSFELYYSIMGMSVIESEYFNNNKNFQRGHIHKEVEEKHFSWLYNT